MTLRRALIVGHFSTIGDVECLEAVQEWCAAADLVYDVAPYSKSLQARIAGAIAPEAATPARYSHVIIVCGPCYPELLERNGVPLDRFAHCQKIGVNLTLTKPLSVWNPFDLLIERDSDRAAHPDLTFARKVELKPVVGRCLVKRQREYGDRQKLELAVSQIDGLIARHTLPYIDIATDWPGAKERAVANSTEALSSIISRVDVLLTNRLHGLVFALKNGVPALAIDGIEGGDKLSAQARVLGWPVCLRAGEATEHALDEALAWCLSAEAKEKARSVSAAAAETARGMQALVMPILAQPAKGEARVEPAGLGALLRRLVRN